MQIVKHLVYCIVLRVKSYTNNQSELEMFTLSVTLQSVHSNARLYKEAMFQSVFYSVANVLLVNESESINSYDFSVPNLSSIDHAKQVKSEILRLYPDCNFSFRLYETKEIKGEW